MPSNERQPPSVDAVVVSHPSRVWGAQLRLLDLAPRLEERGVRLTLAAPDGLLTDEWRARGLPAVHLQLPPHQLRQGPADGANRVVERAHTLAAVASSVPPLVSLLRRFDAALSFSLSAHLETAIAGRIARRPVVVEVVDIVQTSVGRGALRAAHRLSTATIANSEATAATLGPPRRPLHVIHPGVDVDRFCPGPPDPAVRAELCPGAPAPLVAIVGRVDPDKGIEVVVEAMAQLRGPAAAAHLVVVGDVGVGPDGYRDELVAWSRALLGDRVHFVGRRADIPAVLRAVDVLVNASPSEPFGRSVLEAQASGTPVVGGRGGGIPEFVEHEVTGLLVPPSDPQAFAAALQRLLDDEDLRERLSRSARAQAEHRFSLQSRYDMVAHVLRGAMLRPACISSQVR